MRLRDDSDDADDRALFPGVVEEGLLALLHGAQVVPGREVADARPLRPVTPFRDLLGPRPLVGLGLQEPICHVTPSSFLGMRIIGSACGSSSLASSPSAGSSGGRGGSASETSSAPAQSATAAGGAEGRETVYVFNVGSKDVTLIDVADRQVRETRPLGASVRWLSNEQTYWDGARIWTYDFPNDQVQAIAIEPRQVAVTKTIGGLGKGPGHSLVVLPDKKKAAV